MRASAKAPHELRVLMRHRKVRTFGLPHRIILGLLFLPGLHSCFPLRLLTQRLLGHCSTRVIGSALTRWRVVIVRALHPVLIVGQSCYPLRRDPSRLSELIRLLRRYNVLRVQEARRMEHVGPGAVQLSLTLSCCTLGEGLSTE